MTQLIKPMKAHKYKPSKVIRPGFLQPKLNGLRAIWNGHNLNTYNLEQWSPSILSHITHRIKQLGLADLQLDGEIYVHGRSLQWINSRSAVTRLTPHKEENLIQFHVFDYPSDSPFSHRIDQLKTIITPDPTDPIQLCPTYSFSSEHEENQVFKLCRMEGYEGMIYREAQAGYGFLRDCGNQENRWWRIMKRKFWEDMDATVIGCKEGLGKFAGSLGAFICVGENGSRFTVGTGEALTHEMRDQYWKRRDVMAGVTLKVKYEMLSDGGVPLKPTVEAVYE